jgi:hypothetical protein
MTNTTDLPSVAEVKDVFSLDHNRMTAHDYIVAVECEQCALLARLPDDAVLVTRDTLAAALVDSDLIRRYMDYAGRAPHMSPDVSADMLATSWSDLILAAVRRG